MNLFKAIVSKLFLRFGYRIVRADYDTVSPTFHNLINIVCAYEYLFQEYRSCKIIPANKMRIELATRLLGTPPSEAYFIVEAIARTQSIEGDICEFGVAQGETSSLMANEIRNSEKRLHLFDSFEGLPKPTAKDTLKDDIFELGSIEKYEGTMSFGETWVKKRLKAISFSADRYVIHKGFIEKIIHEDQALPHKVAFAYIDFDFYEPISITLNFLHDIIPEGGMIIVDDYDFFSTGVKCAVDEFLDQKNVSDKYYHVEIPDKRFGCFAILYKMK